MKERFITGAMILFVVALMFLTKIIMNVTWIFDVFIVLILIISAFETSRIFKKIGLFDHEWLVAVFPLLLYGLIILCIQLQLAFYWFIIYAIALLFVLAIVSFVISLATKNRTTSEIRIRGMRYSFIRFSFNKAGNTLVSMIYPTVSMILLVVLNHIEEMSYAFSNVSGFEGNLSIILLAVAFIIPFIADTFAYLSGSLFGGKKLCPRISPIKTISGAIGGVVWTIIFLVVLFLIFSADTSLTSVFVGLGLQWWHWIILGFVGAIACIYGDLFESYLKRKAEIKDSSDILPGHGGLLDRIDSFAFSTPIVFIFFLFFII